MTLYVGYAQQIISPSLDAPVYLAGFGANRVAQTLHDDLFARALALQYEETRLVLAALDLIGLGRSHCQEIERRVQSQAGEPVRLILACTHTHHGPDTIGFWGPDRATSGVDPAYMEGLLEKVTQTCLQALGALQPAPNLCAVNVPVPGLSKNARDPLILDIELIGLRFCQGSQAVASLVIFPCHPEVLWEENPHITSDYPGVLRREIETASGAPCLFFSGALGGMMTPNLPGHTFQDAEFMGWTLAQAALQAWQQAQPTAITSLAQRSLAYTIPLTNPLFQMAAQAGLIPQTANEAGEITTETNLVQIGGAWLVTAPGELLPRLGLEIKALTRQAGAQTAAVIGLANDELGYILPEESFQFPENPFEPEDHYEETMSIGPEAGPRLLAAVNHILDILGLSATICG